MIRLKDCLLAACLVSPLTQAADLGTWGDLWPVREQDMLQLITQRLQSLQSSGQWDQTMDAFKQRVIENSQRRNLPSITSCTRISSASWRKT